MEILSLNMDVNRNDNILLSLNSKNNENKINEENSNSFKEVFENIRNMISNKEEKETKIQKNTNNLDNPINNKETIKEQTNDKISKNIDDNNRKTGENSIKSNFLNSKIKEIMKNNTKKENENISDKKEFKKSKINSSDNFTYLSNILNILKYELDKIKNQNSNKENEIEKTIKLKLNVANNLISKIENNKTDKSKIESIIESLRKEINSIKYLIENSEIESLENKKVKNLKDILKSLENKSFNSNENNIKIGLKSFSDKIIEKSENSLKQEVKKDESKVETKKINLENKRDLSIKEKKIDKKIIENEMKREEKENNSYIKDSKTQIDKELFKNNKTENETKIDFKNYKEIFEKIMKQIGESAKGFITKDTAHLTIQLKPETLGKIKIIINMKDDVINGRIVVENENVKNIISNEIEKVKETLASSGINLDHLDVYSQNQESNRETYQEYLIHKTSSFLRKFNNEDENKIKNDWIIDKNYYLNSNIYIKA